MHVTQRELNRRHRLDPRLRADIGRFEPLPREEIESIAREMRSCRVKAWAALGDRDPGLRAAEDKDDVALRKSVAESSKATAARGHVARLDALVARMEKHNLRLVVVAAQKYLHHPAAGQMFLDDLVAYGCVGLRTGVLRFDPDRGVLFSTFAMWWIRHTIVRSILDYGHRIRIPVHLADRITRVRRAMAAIMNRAGLTGEGVRRPSVEQIAAETKMTKEEVEKAMRCMDLQAEEVSLHWEIHKESDAGSTRTTILMDTVEDESPQQDETLEAEERLEQLDGILRSFSARQPELAKILCERAGIGVDDPRTLSEIAKDFELSRERIRQLETKAMQMVTEQARQPNRLQLSNPVVRRRVGRPVQQEMTL